MPIRVLVVDDSAIVRQVLSEALATAGDIEVVGAAPDPFIARDKIVQLEPDVITLDIEMPRMDGLTFLERLMAFYPLPVIIVSSVTTSDKHAAIRALEIGAFDVVNKPGGAISVVEILEDIVYKVRQAYEVRETFVRRRVSFREKYGDRPVPRLATQSYLRTVKTTDMVIAVGASTGGTVALEYLFRQLPGSLPPLVVVQHMPPHFTRQFAQRLDSLSPLEIRESEDGEILTSGTVLVAPGGYHLTVERRGAALYTRLVMSERVQFQRPSADVLFQSVAASAGQNAVGVLLTGMGRDGASGLLGMKSAGAVTIAQDEASSVVWGMPRAAVELGAASEVLPLDTIAARLVDLSRTR